MSTNRIDLEENRVAYITKMERQIREADAQIKELETIATDRGAQQNKRVEGGLEELGDKLDELRDEFRVLQEESVETWPERSRDVSQTYKELEEILTIVSSRTKRK